MGSGHIFTPQDPGWIEVDPPANNTGEISTFCHALTWVIDYSFVPLAESAASVTRAHFADDSITPGTKEVHPLSGKMLGGM